LAESAKTAQLALFAAKMLPNLPERANRLIVWDQPGNFQHFVQSRTSARDRHRPGYQPKGLGTDAAFAPSVCHANP
jgi:hypothetical protein